MRFLAWLGAVFVRGGRDFFIFFFYFGGAGVILACLRFFHFFLLFWDAGVVLAPFVSVLWLSGI
ncbi:MAG: hypothetical protein MR964_04790 [Campylobacter sp.]|uniref:hypothetical protein n=1 Tax=Campylobacter sp. TaxID=205 RepID=UPI002AA7CC91|nr:hypothetical protein [Campylobacter sp.]MCI7023527.1 hypothetical protein [Campylobacter sp.]